MSIDRAELEKRTLYIGRIKRLLENGYNYVEIARTLDLPESTVRSYAKNIKEAE